MSGLKYEFEDSIPFGNGLQLLYVTSEVFNTDWHSIPHSHSCTELFYCVSGIGQFIINNETLPVGSNDLIIINSNIEHTEISYSTNPLKYIVLGVDNIHFDLDNSQNRGWLALNFSSKKDDIINVLNELLYELRFKRRHYEKIISLLSSAILFRITRHAALSYETIRPKDSNMECDKVKRYIDLNFHSNITLDNLSEVVHLNKFYLSHKFSEVYNISPMNYLLNVRIKESKYLLDNTNYSVSQISQILGFSSPSYFSQSFKKKVGVSPSQYKKKTNNSKKKIKTQNEPDAPPFTPFLN